MNANDIRNARKDAWEEFGRTGEIANSANNLLVSVDELQCRLAKIGIILKSGLPLSNKDIELMRELTEI
jgi:hypothetical protein